MAVQGTPVQPLLNVFILLHTLVFWSKRTGSCKTGDPFILWPLAYPNPPDTLFDTYLIYRKQLSIQETTSHTSSQLCTNFSLAGKAEVAGKNLMRMSHLGPTTVRVKSRPALPGSMAKEQAARQGRGWERHRHQRGPFCGQSIIFVLLLWRNTCLWLTAFHRLQLNPWSMLHFIRRKEVEEINILSLVAKSLCFKYCQILRHQAAKNMRRIFQ